MKIAIWYDGGTTTNMGDRAILTAILSQIEHLHECTILCDNPHEMQRYYGVNAKKIHFWNPIRILLELRKFDLLIWGGGSILQDQSSIAYVIFQSYLPMLARVVQTPVFCCAVGIGPLQTFIGKKVSAFALNRVSKIVVREHFALDTLREVGVNTINVELTEDPAVLLPREGTREKRKKKHITIGLNCRMWFHYTSRILPGKILNHDPEKGIINIQQEKLEEKFSEICTKLCNDYETVHFLCVPMYFGGYQQDEKVLKRIISKIKSTNFTYSILEARLPVNAIKMRISSCDVFIGVRLHSLILSCTEYVPVVGIHYLPKGRQFFERLGLQEQSFWIDDFKTIDVYKSVSEILKDPIEVVSKMKSELPKMKSSSLRTFEILEDVLASK